jgi:hypothetical protein
MNPFESYTKPRPSEKAVSTIQSKLDGPVSAVLTLPRVKLTTSLPFILFLKKHSTTQPLSHGDSKVPPWNFLPLGWILLSKNW